MRERKNKTLNKTADRNTEEKKKTNTDFRKDVATVADT